MLIDVKNLFKIYHEGEESEVRALDGVSLSVDRGEFLAIIGQSGSGKSTLMNILGCLDIPTYGDYHLDGEKGELVLQNHADGGADGFLRGLGQAHPPKGVPEPGHNGLGAVGQGVVEIKKDSFEVHRSEGS